MPIVADTDSVHVVEAGVHRAIQEGDVIVPCHIHVAIKDYAVIFLIAAGIQSWSCWNGVIVNLQNSRQTLMYFVKIGTYGQ